MLYTVPVVIFIKDTTKSFWLPIGKGLSNYHAFKLRQKIKGEEGEASFIGPKQDRFQWKLKAESHTY